MNSTYEDYKALQRAEEMLSKIALKYKTIFDNNMDAIVCMDSSGKFFSWNIQAEKLFGWKASEIIGKTVADTIVPPQYRDSHINGLYHYLSTGQGPYLNKLIEISAMTKEGEQFPVELTVISILEDNIRFFCAFIRDISQRKNTEASIQLSHQRLKDAETIGKTGYWHWDAATGFVTWSEGTYYVFGEKQGNFNGTLEDFINRVCSNEREIIQNKLTKVYETKIPDIYEFWIETPSGERKFISTTAEVVLDGNGTVTALFGTTRDNTEHKKAQEKEKKYIEIQNILAELNQGVHQASKPEEIYELALNTLLITTGADKAAIMLFDSDNIMRFVADRNLSLRYKKAVEGHSPWKAGESDAKPIFVPEVFKEPTLQNLLPFISEEGIVALAFIPLVHKQQLLGKLVVYFTDVHHFTPGEIQVIQNISGVVAFAIWEKRATIALRESEEKYRAFFESSIDGILLVIPDQGKIIAANGAACEMLGMNEDEICRLGRAGIVDQNDPQFTQFLKQRQKQGKVSAELNLIRKDGSKFPVEVSSSFFYDAAGNEKASVFFRDITERKKNEEALAKSELYLRSILHSTNDGILAIDYNGKVITANNRFAELWRIPPVLLQQNDDKALLEFVLDQLIDPRAFFTKVQELYKSDKLSFDTLYFKDDRVFERFSTPLVLNGQIVGRVWSFRDVTIQTKIEKSLRESEQRTRHVLSSTADTFYVIDRNFRVTIINESAEKNLEKAWGKTVKAGTDVLEVIPAQSLEMIKANYIRVFAGEKVEYEIRQTSEGLPEWVHITYQPVSDEKGNITGAYIVSKDITERKKAEEKLRLSEELLLASIQNTPNVAVQWYNRKGVVLFWNQASVNIFGFKPEEAFGKTLDQLIHTPEAAAEFVECLKLIEETGQTIGPTEFSFKRRDGSVGYCVSTIFSIPSVAGEPRFVCMDVDITEQKNAEAIVKESENRLRTIYETEPECIKLLNSKGELLEMNPAGLAMIEADNLEMVKGKQVLGIVAPEYRNEFDRLTQNVFKGHSGTLEFEIIGLKGTHRWLETHAVPMKDASGNIIALLGVTRNITERKKAEKALKESEEKYRTLVEQASDGILVTDLQGTIVDMNSRLCDMFGYSKEEAVNKNVIEFLYPENVKKQPLRFNQLFGDQSLLLERVAMHRDGTIFDIELNTRMIGENMALSVIRNISERKKAEKLLKESEEKYRTLVEQASDPIMIYSLDGKILDCNHAFMNATGYQKENLEKMSLIDLLFEGDLKSKPIVFGGIKKGFAVHDERRIKRKDGSAMSVELNSKMMPDGNVMVIGRDITERKKAQEQILREKQLSNDIIDSIPGVFFLRTNDKFLRWNKKFEEITGYTTEEISSLEPITAFYSGDDLEKLKKFFNKLDDNNSLITEAMPSTKAGIKIPYYMNARIINYEGQRCIICTGIDISDRKKAEQELQESYKEIRTLTEHLQNIREEERKHMAREIHDELGQQLTVMKMDISWINKKITGSTDAAMKEKTKELMALLDQTVKTVRRISSELRPSLLDDLGLTAAMEWQLHEFGRRSGIKTSLEVPQSDTELSDNYKTGLFRIFQESLTNVVRHSNASQVNVTLSQTGNKLILSITDDGEGFDKQKIAEKKTLGILGMKERTSMIGGSYEIASTPGKGTKVVVTIPLIQQ